MGLAGVHLFLSKPSGVLYGLLDIFPLQVGIAFEDFFERSTMRDLVHDDRDRNPHAPNTGPATHDLRVKRDSIEHVRSLHRCRNRNENDNSRSEPGTTERASSLHARSLASRDGGI